MRSPATPARTGVAVDEGLRAYMLGVYNYMAAGIALTGVTRLPHSAMHRRAGRRPDGQLTPFGEALYKSPLKWVVMLAPLGFVFFLSFRVEKMSVGAAQIAFWLFAAVMGVSLSSIFLVFTGQSITQVFFVTAAAFGAPQPLRLHDEAGPLRLGLVPVHGPDRHHHRRAGQHLPAVERACSSPISVIGVLVFAGLTAYDTQRIKDGYYDGRRRCELAMAKSAIMGALSLYLDFINMFMMLLKLFGNRE